MLRNEVRASTTLSVSEVYQSFQGEGLLSGTPSLFIRLQGCNIRCSWCDQKSSLEFKSKDLKTIDELLDMASGLKHIVITGGEPMAHSGLPALVRTLLKKGHTVQIETNGTLWQDGLESLSNLFITCSPKPVVNWTVHPKVLDSLFELKFVVDKELTLDVLLREDFRPHLDFKTTLQPEGNKEEFFQKAWEIAKKLSEIGYSVRVLPQLHKILGFS
ncbi:MAG: 7-carboxy-7-deazaguanine synthase QueE [Aquificaceae bacterium]|nr:7-carboxy-7-deazaguanine synthase QueE [Aquificaceae bacterium]MDW8236950.1 7-carboxy-7-deazaguanine synthase QueE [Aquificaceae bacterium]